MPSRPTFPSPWLRDPAALRDSLDFPFNFYEGQRIYNTFLAHQLLTWAGQHGKQSELQMALFESPPTCCNL
ncbi:MAG: hypothetical protein ACERNK_13860 [Deltaproteobacteria bacterium]